MSETRKHQLRTLPNLVAKDVQHPHDIAATAALKAVPGLDKVIAKIMEYNLERVFYLENIASSVQVTPRMFGRLHRSLGWGCQILDLEEPELYVTLDPMAHAWESVRELTSAARMLSKPRNKNRRKPRTALIWPNTGSTITLRRAYRARPSGVRTFAAMCSLAVAGGSLTSAAGVWCC